MVMSMKGIALPISCSCRCRYQCLYLVFKLRRPHHQYPLHPVPAQVALLYLHPPIPRKVAPCYHLLQNQMLHHLIHGTTSRLKHIPSLEGCGEAPLSPTCVRTWSVDADGCKTESYQEDEQCWEIYERED
jgi:hypothetical protein